MAIEKYAEAKGLDVKEVKAKWLPILQAEKEKDPFTESLVNACTILGQIKEISKGLDPTTQEMLGRLSSVVVNRALDPQAKESDDDGDEKVIRSVRRLKILDRAFADPDKETEEIARRVSEEVSAPIAEALAALQETLERIAPKIKAEPEAARSPEFAALQQTMENLNTTLVKLEENRKNDGAPSSDGKLSAETMMEQLGDATEKAKNFLGKQGYKFVAEGSPATLDEAKKMVEDSGFTLQDQRVSRDEAKRMAEDATTAERKKYETDLELKLEERKIAAAEKVVGAAIDKVMEPIKYFMEKYLDTAVNPETSPPAAKPPAAPASVPIPPKKIIKIEGPPPQPYTS
jgi:Mn-dependent DtxR family transcriptional regulator